MLVLVILGDACCSCSGDDGSGYTAGDFGNDA